MKTIRGFLPAAAPAVLLFVLASCSGGSRMIPSRAYRDLRLPDGEFLHYSYYYRGEKASDNYMVTRKVTNGRGGYLYRIYFDGIRAGSGKTPPAEYTTWPMNFLIDPQTGSLLESEGRYNSNFLSFGGFFYSHYRYFQDKGFIEYRTKSFRNKETNENIYHVKVKNGFPLWDMWSGIYFILRFLDVYGAGIAYLIIPEASKEPIPFTLVTDGRDTVTTKAGTFHVVKAKMPMGDPFLGKLLDPMMGNAYSMVEDSDRRLVVKVGAADNNNILEEISNVHIK